MTLTPSLMTARSSPLYRISLLLLLLALWIYAGSVFSPWAASRKPRLWLYDTVFYTGYALLFWGGGEALRLIAVRRKVGSWRPVAGPLAMLFFAAALALSNYLLHHTGPGWRLRVELSAAALRSRRAPLNSDQPVRVGWLIVDTARSPCGDQAWLWLGRPFGGGTGINLALVHSPAGVPLSPLPEAFRFRRLNGEWWMAYQNPRVYRQSRKYSPSDCEAGIEVKTHREGLGHIAG